MTDDLAEAKRHIRALLDILCRGGNGDPLSVGKAQKYLDGSDAEGQTVEGGDEDDDLPAGPTPSILAGAKLLQTLYHNSAPHEAAPVFAQPEHDRTVRLAALEEVRNALCDYCANGVEFTGHWHVWHTGNAADITAGCKAQPIRSLIDQTGGEGGI